MAESHSYNVTLACEIGINCAVMLQHFHFLQREKAANNKQEMEGTFVRRSTLALTTTYPYWSEKVIKKIVADLEEKGLLFAQVLNKNTYDRTKSYTLSAKALAFFDGRINSLLGDCIVPNGTMDRPKRSDDIVPDGPILNNYTDNYTDSYTVNNNSANAHFLSLQNEAQENSATQKAEPTTTKGRKKNEDVHRADALQKNVIQLKEEFMAELQRKGVAQYYEPFKEVWQEWIRYKKEIRTSYKSAQSAATGFKNLLEKSNYNAEKALRLVENTVANGWKGIQDEKIQKPSYSSKSKVHQQHDETIEYLNESRQRLINQFGLTNEYK
jgi:sulfur relay (sulfurtransferase) DsrF/TusC family protein